MYLFHRLSYLDMFVNNQIVSGTDCARNDQNDVVQNDDAKRQEGGNHSRRSGVNACAFTNDSFMYA